MEHYKLEIEKEEERWNKIKISKNMRRNSETNMLQWFSRERISVDNEGHGDLFKMQSLEFLDLELRGSLDYQTTKETSLLEPPVDIKNRVKIKRSKSMHPDDNSIMNVHKAQVRHAIYMQERSRKLFSVTHSM